MKTAQLSARKVHTVKKPGYHLDGAGLYLQVKELKSKQGTSLTKSWVYRFTVAGRTQDMGLGSVATFSLAEARERARAARQLVADGINPIQHRRQHAVNLAAVESFQEAATEFLSVWSNEWRNAKHRAQWRSTLEAYAYPRLGTLPVLDVDGAAITEALAPIWTEKRETARRVKQRIERVVQWAKDGKPLPNSPGKHVKHHPAMAVDELPAFMAELRERDSISARALEFTILTAARTSEAIGATWEEIDLEEGTWTVPAERMKAHKPHTVPLSKAVLDLLRALPRVKGESYVFPGARAVQPLSNMAMLELLRGMNGDGLSVHGFRSSFRDWAGDHTNFARNVIEHALAHRIKDKAEAAYRRSDALEKRRKLMEAWASYCAKPLTGNVRRLHGKAA